MRSQLRTVTIPAYTHSIVSVRERPARRCCRVLPRSTATAAASGPGAPRWWYSHDLPVRDMGFPTTTPAAAAAAVAVAVAVVAAIATATESGAGMRLGGVGAGGGTLYGRILAGASHDPSSPFPSTLRHSCLIGPHGQGRVLSQGFRVWGLGFRV